MTKFGELFSDMTRYDKEKIGRIICSHMQCVECPLRKVCYGCLDDRGGGEIVYHDDIYVYLAEWAMDDQNSFTAKWRKIAKKLLNLPEN